MGRFSFRHPKTQSQKRVWAAMLEAKAEHPELALDRSRRGPRMLPCAWDDIWVEDDRCWKSHRRTQYRVRPEPRAKEDRPAVTWHTSERTLLGYGAWGFGFLHCPERDPVLHDVVQAYLRGDATIQDVRRIDPRRAKMLSEDSVAYRVRLKYQRHRIKGKKG